MPFIDTTFFPAIEEMWTRWLRSGAPIHLSGGREHPSEPEHYDGGLWRWPDLERVLVRVCGPDFRSYGLEATFSKVAAAGQAEADLYTRGIELTLFHRMRALEATNVAVHIRYLAHHLKPGDVVLTFNYDPILETALQLLPPAGGTYWHPSDGYGLTFEAIGADPDPGTRPSTAELLKLHGSMNWLAPIDAPPRVPFKLLRILPNSLRGAGFVVRRDDQGTAMRPVIVPPRPEKDYEALGLAPLWQRAGEALSAARTLTVIGYRMPATDMAALELLSQAAARMKPETTVAYVTRGDNAAIQRFQSVFPRSEVHVGGFRLFVDRVTPQ